MVDNKIKNNITDCEDHEETTNFRTVLYCNTLTLRNGIEYQF